VSEVERSGTSAFFSTCGRTFFVKRSDEETPYNPILPKLDGGKNNNAEQSETDYFIQ